MYRNWNKGLTLAIPHQCPVVLLHWINKIHLLELVLAAFLYCIFFFLMEKSFCLM